MSSGKTAEGVVRVKELEGARGSNGVEEEQRRREKESVGKRWFFSVTRAKVIFVFGFWVRDILRRFSAPPAE